MYFSQNGQNGISMYTHHCEVGVKLSTPAPKPHTLHCGELVLQPYQPWRTKPSRHEHDTAQHTGKHEAQLQQQHQTR
jgi:hypothetical protein